MQSIAQQPKTTESSLRPATKADIGTILAFIRELAEFEKIAHEMVVTEEVLTKNMFGPRPYAECLMAEVDGAPAGYAIFFHNFSTFVGKPGLFVEDVYVSPAYRSHGIGMKFFRALAEIALQRDCGRMEWSVLDWNQPAIDFYKKIGAQTMAGWLGQRLSRAEIEKLASPDK